MMQRIKDIFICFMTKLHKKKSVLCLLWILFCLFVPLKSAYPYCLDFLWGPVSNFFHTEGCFDYLVTCTTEAEGLDAVSKLTSLGFSFDKNNETNTVFEKSACYTYSEGVCVAIVICYTEWYVVDVVPQPFPIDPNIGIGSGTGSGGGCYNSTAGH